jgi:hypothetical protein
VLLCVFVQVVLRLLCPKTMRVIKYLTDFLRRSS